MGKNNEIEKGVVHVTVEIIGYLPQSMVSKTILKKLTGNVSVMSFDIGEGLPEKKIPFDSYLEVIDGMAEVVINGNLDILLTGQSIVIPAHASHSIVPNGRFKLIVTIIKSGYEEFSPAISNTA